MTAGPLAGQVALVTGASRGIGLAIARALAADGAAVVVHGLDPGETAAAAAQVGERSAACVADLADPEAAVAAIRSALGARGADILVVNASAEVRESWDAVTGEAMALQWAVNLSATVRIVQLCLPGMLARGFGRIVAIGSVQEARPNATALVYAASKAAQTQMMLNLARTAVRPGVTVNVVQPGAILTDRNRAVLADAAYRDAVLARIPQGRIGEPADVVGAVRLLAGEGGAYINGATVAVDGGMRL
jgi:NAD(P)-dependent dehydrogenase (short-subunit alcohol dehydrogenase family)